MNTAPPPRKKKSFKNSLHAFLRIITRTRRSVSDTSEISHATDRKIKSLYHLRRGTSVAVIEEKNHAGPLSARGPKKTNLDEINIMTKVKRTLSIDQVRKSNLNEPISIDPLKSSTIKNEQDKDQPSVNKSTISIQPQVENLKLSKITRLTKSSISSPTTANSPTTFKSKRVIKKDDDTKTSTTQEISEMSSKKVESDYTLSSLCIQVDSDTNRSNTTESESTLDDTTLYDEEYESVVGSVPPPVFTIDEYTNHSLLSYDGKFSSSSVLAEEKTLQARIHELAIQGSIEELRSLLQQNPEHVQCSDRDGSTPLHQAGRHNRANVIEMLIAEPFYADINCKDFNDSTPLHWAAVHGALDAILALCRNGAQINIRDKYGKGPLHLAIVKRCYRGANIMLLYGADINFKRADGSSAFHIACELGDIPTIEWLVTKDKVMVNCRDKQGETPLLRAATQGKLEVVEYIMKTELMSWNTRDDKQQSLLHRAAFYGYYDLISRIAFINPTACKIMLNEPDRSGETPLHMAVKRDHFREVKLLCKMGADPSMMNRNGDTPLHLAIKYNRIKIARYLYMTAKEVADIKNKRTETPRSMAKRLGPEAAAVFMS